MPLDPVSAYGGVRQSDLARETTGWLSPSLGKASSFVVVVLSCCSVRAGNYNGSPDYSRLPRSLAAWGPFSLLCASPAYWLEGSTDSLGE